MSSIPRKSITLTRTGIGSKLYTAPTITPSTEFHLGSKKFNPAEIPYGIPKVESSTKTTITRGRKSMDTLTPYQRPTDMASPEERRKTREKIHSLRELLKSPSLASGAGGRPLTSGAGGRPLTSDIGSRPRASPAMRRMLVSGLLSSLSEKKRQAEEKAMEEFKHKFYTQEFEYHAPEKKVSEYKPEVTESTSRIETKIPSHEEYQPNYAPIKSIKRISLRKRPYESVSRQQRESYEPASERYTGTYIPQRTYTLREYINELESMGRLGRT